MASTSIIGKPPGVLLDEQQLSTVLSALGDAADYRKDIGDCSDCEEVQADNPDGSCDDHGTDLAIAGMYDLLHDDLQARLAELREAEGK